MYLTLVLLCVFVYEILLIYDKFLYLFLKLCSGKMCAAEMYCQFSCFSGFALIHHMKTNSTPESFMDSFQ